MSEEHPPFLAHHFDTPGQQFEAGKLGMWLFLATEVLLFGGLFVVYTVFRRLHPDMFAYGSQFLDVRWGATNTCILILSSLTMATAVTTTQQGRRGLSLALLVITFFGGVGFMAIKYVEYSHKIHDNLVWGVRFYEEPAHALAAHGDEDLGVVAIGAPDPVRGQTLWTSTCRGCHGLRGEGILGQGKDQRNSEFIRGQSDEDLVAFVKVGRMPFDPANTTGIQMPPKGGNPMLDDADLADIVAFMRGFPGLDPSIPPADLGEADAAAAEAAGDAASRELYMDRWIIPEPPLPPTHLNVAALEVGDDAPTALHDAGPPDPRHDPHRPANAHMFFAIYFMMTGLHGIHVIIGMAVIGWLIALTYRRRMSAEYFTPVDLGGLYWHVVDLIWIFLFPLFYLI